MQRPFLTALVVLSVAMTAARAQPGEQPGELRVCAEPDNFPVSDRAERGFENRIARVIADELGLALRYSWHPYWRGFVRKTLGAQRCDVLIGVPSDFDRVLTTRPYYRSAYVFVSPAGAEPVAGFHDARLARERIGLPLIKNDLTTTPPGFVLAPAGPRPNLVGFSVYEEPPAAQRIAEAVARGELGVGVLWGPQAGHFARTAQPPLQVAVARPPAHAAWLPFEYAISMGVRKSDRGLRDRLDAAIERRRDDIDRILAEFAVPRTDRPGLAVQRP